MSMRERERDSERAALINGCPPYTQPAHMAQAGTAPTTSQLQDGTPTNWATLARATTGIFKVTIMCQLGTLQNLYF